MAHTTTKKMSHAGLLNTQAVKVKRDSRDSSFFYNSVIVVAIIGLVLFAYLQTRLSVVQTGYDISVANTERSKLVDINKRLKLEQTALKAPERVEKIAREEFGLNRPAPSQIIRINE